MVYCLLLLTPAGGVWFGGWPAERSEAALLLRTEELEWLVVMASEKLKWLGTNMTYTRVLISMSLLEIWYSKIQAWWYEFWFVAALINTGVKSCRYWRVQIMFMHISVLVITVQKRKKRKVICGHLTKFVKTEQIWGDIGAMHQVYSVWILNEGTQTLCEMFPDSLQCIGTWAQDKIHKIVKAGRGLMCTLLLVPGQDCTSSLLFCRKSHIT